MNQNKKESKNLSKVTFLFSVFFILLISPALAAENDEILVFKQNQQIDLFRPCFNNGTYCSSSAICNSTVIASGTPFRIVVNNTRESNNGAFHNFSVSQGLAGNLGTYNVIRSCTDPNGDISGSGFETYNFLVTPSGTEDNSLAQFLFLGFALIFSGGIIALGFYKNEPYFVLFGAIGLTLFGLFTLINGVGNYRNNLTEGISIIAMGLSGYILTRTSLELMEVI